MVPDVFIFSCEFRSSVSFEQRHGEPHESEVKTLFSKVSSMVSQVVNVFFTSFLLPSVHSSAAKASATLKQIGH
jgi:hypothetical protein